MHNTSIHVWHDLWSLSTAHIPLFLYPFLHTVSKSRPFEYLRLTSLGVVGALVKVTTSLLVYVCWCIRNSYTFVCTICIYEWTKFKVSCMYVVHILMILLRFFNGFLKMVVCCCVVTADVLTHMRINTLIDCINLTITDITIAGSIISWYDCDHIECV